MYSWWSKLMLVCILKHFDVLGLSTASLRNRLSQSSDRSWEGVGQNFLNAQLKFCSQNVRAWLATWPREVSCSGTSEKLCCLLCVVFWRNGRSGMSSLWQLLYCVQTAFLLNPWVLTMDFNTPCILHQKLQKTP